MKQLEILNLAWKAQLHIWSKEKDLLERYPADIVAQIREQEAYEKVMILSKLLEVEERKEA